MHFKSTLKFGLVCVTSFNSNSNSIQFKSLFVHKRKLCMGFTGTCSFKNDIKNRTTNNKSHIQSL